MPPINAPATVVRQSAARTTDAPSGSKAPQASHQSQAQRLAVTNSVAVMSGQSMLAAPMQYEVAPRWLPQLLAIRDIDSVGDNARYRDFEFRNVGGRIFQSDGPGKASGGFWGGAPNLQGFAIGGELRM